MHTDKLIETGCEKIDILLEKIEKELTNISSYQVKTNCRRNAINIRVCNLQELLRIYKDLVIEENSWKITQEELKDLLEEVKLEVDGFTIEDWKSDVKHFIQEKNLKEEKEKLLKKKESLKNLYSDEKKTLSAIEDLLIGI